MGQDEGVNSVGLIPDSFTMQRATHVTQGIKIGGKIYKKMFTRESSQLQ